MFDFANPGLLWLLWAVPVLAGMFWLARMARRRKLERFGRPSVLAHLMPTASPYKPAIKIVLEMVAIAALVFVLARPRAGSVEKTDHVNGIEVMIAFDVSNSMLASATDDREGLPRIDRAKMILEKLVDRLDNDKVGMVIFAGQSKMQLPITGDYSAAKMYVNDLEPGLISYQGTDIASAIDMAMKGFTPAEDVHKAIILITDSENHDGDAVEAARRAAEAGVQVDVISMGGTKGVPIPVRGRGTEKYMLDADGQVVLTATNAELAREIAKAGNGVCVNGASGSALATLQQKLDTLGDQPLSTVRYSAGAEQFPTFAWLALAFLIMDIFVLDRKIGWLSRINFFTKTSKTEPSPEDRQ